MRSGFTLFETMIVIGIMAIVAAGTLQFLPRILNRTQFSDAKNMVFRTFEEARSRASSGFGDMPHGVYVDAHTITTFGGTSSISGVDLFTLPLPPSVTLTSPATSSIIFSRVSGLPSESTTLTFSGFGSSTFKILISGNGAITLQ